MASEPRRWIAALRNSHDRLASVAGPLTSDELSAPSYDRDWSIADVLSHLGSQTEIFSVYLDAALEGREPPGSEIFQPIWDAWNGRSVKRQSADSIAASEAFVSRVEALSDEQLAGLHAELFGMDLDAVGVFRMKLGEHAVHTWDVAVALDPSAEVATEAVELLVDGLGDLVAHSGKPAAPARRLRVRTTGPARDLLLTVADDVRLEEWSGQDSDGVLEIPAPAFLRLIYGRLDEAHTPVDDIDAPSGALDDLRRVFPGI
jgi:uncharacterized protein (TIGR03083 family)